MSRAGPFSYLLVMLVSSACDDGGVSPVDGGEDPARPVVLKYSCCFSPEDDPTPDSLFTNLGIDWLERDTVRQDDFQGPAGRNFLGVVVCPDGEISGVSLLEGAIRLFLKDKDPDPVTPERMLLGRLDIQHSCSGYPTDIGQSQILSYRSTTDSLFVYGLQPDSLILLHPRMAWDDRVGRPNALRPRFITMSPEGVLTERNVFLQRDASAPDTVN